MSARPISYRVPIEGAPARRLPAVPVPPVLWFGFQLGVCSIPPFLVFDALTRFLWCSEFSSVRCPEVERLAIVAVFALGVGVILLAGWRAYLRA